MTDLTKAYDEGMEKFDDKYRGFELCNEVSIHDRDRLVEFLKDFHLSLSQARVKRLEDEINNEVPGSHGIYQRNSIRRAEITAEKELQAHITKQGV